jgi:serine/threonine protein kinase
MENATPEEIRFTFADRLWKTEKCIVERGILEQISGTIKTTRQAVRKTIRITADPYMETDSIHKRPFGKESTVTLNPRRPAPVSGNISPPDCSTSVNPERLEKNLILLANEARGFDLAKRLVLSGVPGSDRLIEPLYFECVKKGYYPVNLLAASQRKNAEAGDIYWLFSQALSGLSAMHAAKLQHGDFKPQQIFLNDKGGAKLGDYSYTRREKQHAMEEPLPDSSIWSQEENEWGMEGSEGFQICAIGTPRYMSHIHCYRDDWTNDAYNAGASLRHLHTGIYSEFGYKDLTKDPKINPVMFGDYRDGKLEALYEKMMAPSGQPTAAFACGTLRDIILKRTMMCYVENPSPIPMQSDFLRPKP